MDWIMNLFSLLGRWPLLAESYPNLLKAPHSNFDRERISKKSGGRVFAFVSTLFIKCILSTYPHSFLFYIHVPLYPIRSQSFIHTIVKQHLLYPYGLVEKSIYTHDDEDDDRDRCR